MRIAKTITTIFISVFLLFLFSRQIYATCQGVFSCQLDIRCPSGLCPPVCTAYDHYTIQCSHFPDSGHCVSDKTDECIAHSNPYDVDWYVVVDNCSWDAGCIRNCSCAANTCVGYFCSDGCGGWCVKEQRIVNVIIGDGMLVIVVDVLMLILVVQPMKGIGGDGIHVQVGKENVILMKVALLILSLH